MCLQISDPNLIQTSVLVPYGDWALLLPGGVVCCVGIYRRRSAVKEGIRGGDVTKMLLHSAVARLLRHWRRPVGTPDVVVLVKVGLGPDPRWVAM